MSAYRERAAHAWTEDSVRLVATPSSFAKSALFYVQEAGHFKTRAPYFTEREQLDSFLIVYTVSGRGQLTYMDKTYSLLPGQLFFIHCMHYQYYKTDETEPWELLWVHLNGCTTQGLYEQFASEAAPVLTLAPDTPFPSLLRQLIRLQQQRSTQTELRSSRLLVDILTELLLTAQQSEFPFADRPGYITDMMQELDQRYAEKISLDQLASRFAVSKYHLAKEFKRYTGYSPNEYLITSRINHAKEWLQYSDLPVADIAAKVGIDNVSHFINLFKDRVEHTPLAYRKKWQRPK
ncbi:AraC family transcriptional regulator [Paenibacillus rigui]|uniref:AraC family transcriptional regulator n=1 Tax=Paenibacillus rigui TaxID=554312 RepID=UPI0011813C64|nr:helix-turn-helix domain-containing protein [Paenibacillus rigui]